MKPTDTLRLIRRWMIFFMVALFLSGATAIPIDTELNFLIAQMETGSVMHNWLQKVVNAYADTKTKYPYLLYGYDWLAFAHFLLAVLFIGPYRDPVRNIWVIEFGLIACVAVFPLAMIAGHFRGIPIGWRLIDCSFGLIGFIPLWICHTLTMRLSFSQSTIIQS
jgi:hypothetical protein